MPHPLNTAHTPLSRFHNAGVALLMLAASCKTVLVSVLHSPFIRFSTYRVLNYLAYYENM